MFAKDEQGVEAIDRLREWIEKNRAPVTLGVIEAEASDDDRRERIRRFAAMPQVRLASHTYSHPFYWGVFEGKKDADQQPYRYSVFMDGYAADITRETAGTVAFLQSVAPQSSPLLIWSGDGKPGPAVLAAAQKAGLAHYGGGGLHWQSGPLSFADLSPALRPTEWGLQVLTPLIGEPLFAQLWYGEALNFGKVSDWNGQLDLATAAAGLVHIDSCRCVSACARGGTAGSSGEAAARGKFAWDLGSTNMSSVCGRFKRRALRATSTGTGCFLAMRSGPCDFLSPKRRLQYPAT